VKLEPNFCLKLVKDKKENKMKNRKEQRLKDSKTIALVFILIVSFLSLSLKIETGFSQEFPKIDFPGVEKIPDPEFLNEFEKSDYVNIIVLLNGYKRYIGVVDADDKDQMKGIQSEIETIQRNVLDNQDKANFIIKHRFENILGFSGKATLEGIKSLVSSDNVEFVREDKEVYLHLAQGIPLMDAMETRTTYNGSGVSIAIVDTGIDYTHAMLGDGSFPNTKVIGGWDFGDGDNDPDDCQGHGTAVAGVAAGSLTSGAGDYIGGVAHNARLYALKVVPGCSDSANDSDISAAWDWAVTHKNDDPLNPILVINTSMGGEYFTSPCDSQEPDYYAAATNAISNGISLFVSSGNDGFCDGLARPACLSNTISVGAVYDANIGPQSGWCIEDESCIGYSAGCPAGFACDDPTTRADSVTCYSNSADFLDILAPSNNATTTEVGGGYRANFGGTSAASPYAAGAAAIMQSFALSKLGLYLTPAEIKKILIENGEYILDPKSLINKPRIDVQESVDHIVNYIIKPSSLNPAFVGPNINPYNFYIEVEMFPEYLTGGTLDESDVSGSVHDGLSIGIIGAVEDITEITQISSTRYRIGIITPDGISAGISHNGVYDLTLWINVAGGGRIELRSNDSIIYSNCGLEAAPSTKWHPMGTLIKTSDSPAVYIVGHGKKRPFPSEEVFYNHGHYDCSIVTVSQTEMDLIPTGTFVQNPTNRLVKIASQPYVYLVTDDNYLRWIANETVFKGLHFRWGDIETISDTEFLSYRDGPDINSVMPEGSLFRITDDPHHSERVYILSEGKGRWIEDEATFNGLGFSFEHVIETTENIPVYPESYRITSSDLTQIKYDTIAPTAHLAYPNGGQSFTPGSIVTISFSAVDDIGVDFIEVYYSSDRWETFELVSQGKVPKAEKEGKRLLHKSHSWIAPEVETEFGCIKVVAYDAEGGNGFDLSDNYFNIESDCPLPGSSTLSSSSSTSLTGSYWIEWTDIHDVDYYKLQESTDPSFFPAETYSPIYSMSMYFGGKENGTYFYRVSGINGCGQGEWSNVVSVTVEQDYGPGPIESRLPVDGATDQPLSVTLSWSCSHPGGESMTYDVWFSDDDRDFFMVLSLYRMVKLEHHIPYIIYHMIVLVHGKSTSGTRREIKERVRFFISRQ